jgi:hypothetical protein
MSNEVGVALAWHTAPHKTAQDLFDKELIVGGHAGVDPELTPRLYNAVLGTKFKIINGYNGTADIALAMERGEVAGVGDWSWSSLKKQKPTWIRDKQITILLQSGLENDPELPNIPNALEFAKNTSDRKVIELFFTQKTAARPIIAPPGVPADRIATLRTAFAALARTTIFSPMPGNPTSTSSQWRARASTRSSRSSPRRPPTLSTAISRHSPVPARRIS